MRTFLKRINSILLLFGLNPRRALHTLRGFPYYVKTYVKIKKQNNLDNDFSKIRIVPQLDDLYEESGVGRGQYFNQDLFIAQQIYKRKPIKHVDIGSRIDGFVAHVASFRRIEIFDIRPFTAQIENISFKQMNFMETDMKFKDYTDSISSLHAIEHFGLGRYGDPIDINGHKKAIDNIFLMLKPNGIFYFSVPFGSQRIDFNANRIFSMSYLLEIINKFEIESFSFINDEGYLKKYVKMNKADISANYNCKYGCAIFELKKK